MMLESDDLELTRSMGIPHPVDKGRPGRRPKYVKLAPGDNGEYLPDIFFEDPRTHCPSPGPFGQIHAWGLYSYEYPEEPGRKSIHEGAKNWPAFDGFQAMMRQMSHQMTYWNLDSPEKQFMKAILERKKKELKSHNFNGLDKCDVLCKITISAMNDRRGQPRVWRRFKVSAGISLNALQDKVIAPVMGWVRNLHCYTFTDFRDGAIFGPEGSRAVDVAHKAQIGYEYLPDERYRFAHLFSKEGDEIGYLYDFGDKWYHTIKIEKILPVEQSSGSVDVIDSKGMCPGENLQGSLIYEDFLFKYDDADYIGKAKLKREILETPNYKSFSKPPALFDPSNFDQEATKKRVTDALNSASSVPSGAKQFTIPFVPQDPDEIEKPFLKKSQSVIVTRENGSDSDDEGGVGSGYWKETQSNTKDRRRVAVCAACGKPASDQVELKTCSGCRKVWYCSVSHQKDHWKVVHKKECTREFLPK